MSETTETADDGPQIDFNDPIHHVMAPVEWHRGNMAAIQDMIRRASVIDRTMNGYNPLPMLIKTYDRHRNLGYAYEGEDLLTFIKHQRNGFNVICGPDHPDAGRVLARQKPYAEAMDIAYQEAEKHLPRSRRS